MTRGESVQEVAARLMLPQVVVGDVITEYLEVVKEQLVKNARFHIGQLGTFRVTTTTPRLVPAKFGDRSTLRPVDSKKVVKFKASELLNAEV